MGDHNHDTDRPSPSRAVLFLRRLARVMLATGRIAATLAVFGGVVWGGYQALHHPRTPLRAEWNPVKPLRVADSVTALTKWKLARALGDPVLCLAALKGTAIATPLPDLVQSDICHIRGRVRLTSVGAAVMAPVETRCAIALRMAMWERHALQPAATAYIGSPLIRIRHYASYNCRPIRRPSGHAPRMSTHATADAIDVAGFDFEGGKRLTLKQDWNGATAEAAFLHAAQDGACRWFNTVLGPDYNALHADHFHMQNTGWNSCR